MTEVDLTIPAILDRSREIAEPKAAAAASRVHAADQAETIAKRIKDPDAVRRALHEKLEGQRDFAAEYRSKFPSVRETGGPGRGHKTDDSTVAGFAAEDWCKSFGFHIRTVQRWLDLLEADKFASKEDAIRKRWWQLAELYQAANYSSESVEWYTPGKYLEAVREVLGEIDLDPASSAQANSTVSATEIFTEEDDGLSRQWYGNVFMNPPYGKTEKGGSLAGAFCQKAVHEFDAGNISACIILVNSLHSQGWQAPLYEHTICFVDHRIQFVSGDGEENKNPTFQNIFVYLGRDQEKFAEVFSRFGYVMRQVLQ